MQHADQLNRVLIKRVDISHSSLSIQLRQQQTLDIFIFAIIYYTCTFLSVPPPSRKHKDKKVDKNDKILSCIRLPVSWTI